MLKTVFAYIGLAAVMFSLLAVCWGLLRSWERAKFKAMQEEDYDQWTGFQ